jgi:hypothetical protein
MRGNRRSASSAGNSKYAPAAAASIAVSTLSPLTS